MDEGWGALIGFVVIAALVVGAVMVGVAIGGFLLVGIAAAGAASGLFVAGRNFYLVLNEAHTKVPR